MSNRKHLRNRKRRILGDTLDWNSELVEFEFLAELPFWLLTPNTFLEIDTNFCNTKAFLINTGIEIHNNTMLSRDKSNLTFIGSTDSLPNRRIYLQQASKGFAGRFTRTLIAVTANAHRDVLKAISDSDAIRRRDAYYYLASLAVNHLPVLNEIINSYRTVSFDPYAHEVTKKDIPVWHAYIDGNVVAITTDAYLTNDYFPHVGKSSNQKPLYAIDSVGLNQSLHRKSLPGEIEMLDGWSLLHSGRFNESVRSFVTAVEIVVEQKIVEKLKEDGCGNTEIANILHETMNNFKKRLASFCEVTNRRIPGPILRDVPYINGLRFEDEIHRFRNLRNAIVHHGHRLNHTFYKPMLRIAEVTSWFYDWITEEDFELRRNKYASYFFANRTSFTPYACSFEGKIVVEKVDEDSMVSLRINDVYLNDKYFLSKISAFDSKARDMEHFVKIAFFQLNQGELLDTEYHKGPSSKIVRFKTKRNNRTVVVCLLEIDGVLSTDDVDRVRDAIAKTRTNTNYFIDIIVVVDQNRRKNLFERGEMPRDALEHASANGICLISTAKLAKIAMLYRVYKWKANVIIDDILNGNTTIPKCIYSGILYDVWDKNSIAGFSFVSEEYSQSGNRMFIELKDRYQLYKMPKRSVDTRGRITAKVNFTRKEAIIPGSVFAVPKNVRLPDKPISHKKLMDEMLKNQNGIAIAPPV